MVQPACLMKQLTYMRADLYWVIQIVASLVANTHICRTIGQIHSPKADTALELDQH